jgi:hypothetical protein
MIIFSPLFFHRENEEILRDAKRKLDDIRFKLWFYVAEELQQGDQPYQFLRAYKGGIQNDFNEVVDNIFFFKKLFFVSCSGKARLLLYWFSIFRFGGVYRGLLVLSLHQDRRVGHLVRGKFYFIVC